MSTSGLKARTRPDGQVASAAGIPRFFSVAQVAEMFGMSSMTLYRAIQDGQFPAIRVRNRVVIPAQAIEAMAEAAVAERTLIDPADLLRVVTR